MRVDSSAADVSGDSCRTEAGSQAVPVLQPADGRCLPHTKRDYHPSRQLGCLSHIATAPQTQGTSNRANRISGDEPRGRGMAAVSVSFSIFVLFEIRANGCLEATPGTGAGCPNTRNARLIVLPRLSKKEAARCVHRATSPCTAALR